MGAEGWEDGADGLIDWGDGTESAFAISPSTTWQGSPCHAFPPSLVPYQVCAGVWDGRWIYDCVVIRGDWNGEVPRVAYP